MSFKNYPNFVLNLSESDVKGETKSFYQFKSFRLDVEERQLFHHENIVPLTPKAFELLAVLVENRGHLVERNELLQTVWSDSFVEEANITRTIHTLRKTLGENENGNKFIETVAKKGYRFVAEVEEIREQTSPLNEITAESQPAESNGGQQDLSEESASAKSRSPDAAASNIVRPKTRIILLVIGFLTAVCLLFLLSYNFSSDSAKNPSAVKSIAVLPVNPVNKENRDELYEIGIADSLINRLSGMKGFVIRPLSATRKYSNVEQDPIAVGKEQKVDYVLASNYQIADGKIRITAQLFNTANGQTEETYKTEMETSDIFGMQDAVASEIGNKLLKLFAAVSNNPTAKRGTTNEEAYRLYLQGKNMSMKRNLTDFNKSIEYFEQAIRLDPNYASAYAGLAGAKVGANLSSNNLTRSPNDKGRSAENIKEILDKAVRLEPNLAEAYAVRANLSFTFEWNLNEAEKNILRALEIEPNNDHAHWVYSLVLAYRGRFNEAIKEVETALAIYPGALMYMRDRGRFLYYARRYDEAIEQINRVIDLDEDFNTAYRWLWRSYELKGDAAAGYESFIKRLQKTDPEEAEIFQKAYEIGGWQEVRRKQIELIKPAENQPSENSYFEMARISAVLGEKENAFDYLNKSVEQREWMFIMLNVEPTLDSLHDDPRFDELLKHIVY